MLVQQVILAVVGFSSGAVIAGGMFSFIIGLGLISVFADRTRTAKNILLYEDSIAFGGIITNILYIFRIRVPFAEVFLPMFGFFSGIFVGCWALALAEILNIFPIFIRRIKLVKAIPYIIMGLLLGKGIGSFLYFVYVWGTK